MTQQPDPTARRVLIAEDEALIRLDLREMLEEEGYEVCGEAGDGQTAVDMAEQLRPELVILTAFSQRDLVEKAREAGAMAYLVKPFQKKDLLPTIEMALSRYNELVGLEAEVDDLNERLEARKAVERAKGVLMSDHGMSEPEAFRWIQRGAMDRRVSMRAVAEAVLAGTDRPEP